MTAVSAEGSAAGQLGFFPALPQPTEAGAEEASSMAFSIRERLIDAVNNKQHANVVQADIMAKGWLEQLFKLARTNHDAVSFEALQLLCYRNRPAVQKLSSMGAVQLIEEALDASDTGVPAKVACLFLLSTMVAFCVDSHPQVLQGKLLEKLVALCKAAGDRPAASSRHSSKPGTGQEQGVNGSGGGAAACSEAQGDEEPLRAAAAALADFSLPPDACLSGRKNGSLSHMCGLMKQAPASQPGSTRESEDSSAFATSAMLRKLTQPLGGLSASGSAACSIDLPQPPLALSHLSAAAAAAATAARESNWSTRSTEPSADQMKQEELDAMSQILQEQDAEEQQQGGRGTSTSTTGEATVQRSRRGSLQEGKAAAFAAAAAASAEVLPSPSKLAQANASMASVSAAQQHSSPASSMAMCAAIALRNLSHNEANHERLIQSQAVDVLACMMHDARQAPAQRINAAMAVAILVGHEENNKNFIQLDETMIKVMVEVLGHACKGELYLGFFWTVWKLAQAVANLAVNESNKALLAANGAIDVLAAALMGRHMQMELVVRFTLMALWNLAFLPEARDKINARKDMVDHIQALLSAGRHDRVTLDVAKGCLWTLGCTQGLHLMHRICMVSKVMGPDPRRQGGNAPCLDLSIPLAHSLQGEAPPSSTSLSAAAAVAAGQGGAVAGTSKEASQVEAVSAAQGAGVAGSSAGAAAITPAPGGAAPAVAGAAPAAPVFVASASAAAAATAAAASHTAPSAQAPGPAPPPTAAAAAAAAEALVAAPVPGGPMPTRESLNLQRMSLDRGVISPVSRGSHNHQSLEILMNSSGSHIMISYEWGVQAKALALKIELERRQYTTWLDLDKMSGSTLEAMALAVEAAAVVIVCVSKKYKESQACRTEAEYAFRLKKRIIPVMMEAGYRPTGWLGALLGTKLYYNMAERRDIPEKVALLERELAECAASAKVGSQAAAAAAAAANAAAAAGALNMSPRRPGWGASARSESPRGAFPSHFNPLSARRSVDLSKLSISSSSTSSASGFAGGGSGYGRPLPVDAFGSRSMVTDMRRISMSLSVAQPGVGPGRQFSDDPGPSGLRTWSGTGPHHGALGQGNGGGGGSMGSAHVPHSNSHGHTHGEALAAIRENSIDSCASGRPSSSNMSVRNDSLDRSMPQVAEALVPGSAASAASVAAAAANGGSAGPGSGAFPAAYAPVPYSLPRVVARLASTGGHRDSISSMPHPSSTLFMNSSASCSMASVTASAPGAALPPAGKAEAVIRKGLGREATPGSGGSGTPMGSSSNGGTHSHSPATGPTNGAAGAGAGPAPASGVALAALSSLFAPSTPSKLSLSSDAAAAESTAAGSASGGAHREGSINGGLGSGGGSAALPGANGGAANGRGAAGSQGSLAASASAASFRANGSPSTHAADPVVSAFSAAALSYPGKDSLLACPPLDSFSWANGGGLAPQGGAAAAGPASHVLTDVGDELPAWEEDTEERDSRGQMGGPGGGANGAAPGPMGPSTHHVRPLTSLQAQGSMRNSREADRERGGDRTSSLGGRLPRATTQKRSSAERQQGAFNRRSASIEDGAGLSVADLAGGGSILDDPGLDFSQELVEAWSTEHVVQWLHAVQLGELAKQMMHHGIDGRALCGLQRHYKQGSLRACLREDLGIGKVGLMLSFTEELLRLFD